MPQSDTPLTKLPAQIKALISARDAARARRDYIESDRLRDLIEAEGYNVSDTSHGTDITKPTSPGAPNPYLVLMGSGEMQNAGRIVHEEVLTRIGKDRIHISIITTPAGFQPNVSRVYQEYKDFFEQRLQNFHPRVSIIPAHTRKEANEDAMVRMLDTTDYIVTGPGSPSYTVQHLRNTKLYTRIIDKVSSDNASLMLSSAAALAFSRYTLPVYKLYKVGEDLHWMDGLNAYAALFKPLSIIPHLNNTEGGEKLDTSHCYMGKQRFTKLRTMLLKNELLWGIDEQTGVIVDLATKDYSVLGKGSLHTNI